mmetsp:Transcript_83171/g.231948  ORF Transcript_83171/g.231948 Transcript_83171/m.231948 type:complete len:247 (-) Transcript_83171:197-937(-)
MHGHDQVVCRVCDQRKSARSQEQQQAARRRKGRVGGRRATHRPARDEVGQAQAPHQQQRVPRARPEAELPAERDAGAVQAAPREAAAPRFRRGAHQDGVRPCRAFGHVVPRHRRVPVEDEVQRRPGNPPCSGSWRGKSTRAANSTSCHAVTRRVHDLRARSREFVRRGAETRTEPHNLAAGGGQHHFPWRNRLLGARLRAHRAPRDWRSARVPGRQHKASCRCGSQQAGHGDDVPVLAAERQQALA